MKGSGFLAFLGGAVVGGVVALLFAPQSGRETRRQIKDFVDDEVDMAKDFVDRNVTKAKKAVNRGVDTVRDSVSYARDIVEGEIAGVMEAVGDCGEEVVRKVKK